MNHGSHGGHGKSKGKKNPTIETSMPLRVGCVQGFTTKAQRMRRIWRMKVHWLFAVHSVASVASVALHAVDVALLYFMRMRAVQVGSPNALGAIRVHPRSSAAQLAVDLPSRSTMRLSRRRFSAARRERHQFRVRRRTSKTALRRHRGQMSHSRFRA